MPVSLGLAIHTYHDTTLPQPLFMQQHRLLMENMSGELSKCKTTLIV
jgi:hypothetical protein